jgi:hypothetical protein
MRNEKIEVRNGGEKKTFCFDKINEEWMMKRLPLFL